MNGKRIFRLALLSGVVLSMAWLAASFVLYLLSGFLLYKTSSSKDLVYSVPFEQAYVKDSGGDRVDLMWVPARPTFGGPSGDGGANRKTYLYLHGNAGRLPYIIEGLARRGNVLSPAYPGYSGSEGRPNTKDIDDVADLSMEFLRQKGIPDGDIVILGHSLGGSPAVYAAVHYPDVDRVILVNTFLSIEEMCRIDYHFLCIFAGGIHNTAKLAPEARARIRQFYNGHDELIPAWQAKALFELLGSRDKKLFEISGSHATFPIDEALGD